MSDTGGAPRDRGCSRLSDERIEELEKQAKAHQVKLVETVRGRLSIDEESNGAFFSMLFQLAGTSIEVDTDSFCDRAEALFDKIEAYGQEPELDAGWLAEITGEEDTFNFSTENLVSDLLSPRTRRAKQHSVSDKERSRIRQEIEAAIIEEEQSLEQTLAVAHKEDVQDWIETITAALEKSKSKRLDFWQLQKKTHLAPVELFLGLLLGHERWQLLQAACFLSDIQIRLYESAK